jgi:hypothetical protein
MTGKSQMTVDPKMIERMFNTQEKVLENQVEQGKQLAEMPGIWRANMLEMLSEHEKACAKKGISIFRLQAPFVFNITAFIAVLVLVLNGYKAYTSTSSDVRYLKHTVDSHISESTNDG